MRNPKLRLRLATLLLTGLIAGILSVTGQGSLQVGYGVYTRGAGTRLPVGAALFRVSDNAGATISEAGVQAAEPILTGRVFVDEVGTKTGLALANPNAGTATVLYILRREDGTEVARLTRTLRANEHTSVYVSELFSQTGGVAGLRGSLTFESNQPVAAITLRENRNVRGEPLYTTLPVTNLTSPPSPGRAVFPHIAAGGGFVTELLLMNPTSTPIAGDVLFGAPDGLPLSLLSGSQSISRLSYTIPAHGTLQTALTAPALVSGWAVAVPITGSLPPTGSVIFQWRPDGDVVSEAGVAATPASRASRIFVDNAQTQTGFALVNPSPQAAAVTFTLLDRYGTLQETQSITLQPGGHFARYVNELFPEVINGFTGLLDVRSTADLVSITLKLTTNARGDLILTTLPVADLTSASSPPRLIFPQVAMGGNFSTRLILINTDTATAAVGILSFLQSNGSAMVIPLGTDRGSQFPYQIASGGGRQFYPGNSARISSITVVSPREGRATSEITINESDVIRPVFRVIDDTGVMRDDFEVAMTSLEPSVAGIDRDGYIHGNRAGFSTLTVTAGGVISTTTATVVRVNSGVPGFGVKGVVKDLADRLYLAASSEHAILLAQDLRQVPVTYAGIRRNPGLTNGMRLNSQFRNPAFLAFDQASGVMYVSDELNHVIRRVTPGTQGTVETLAGTGVVGSGSGPLLQATFNTPQGIALDNRGNLWVVDSGNHIVRRLNLITGVVETIAGQAGSAGLADGQGTAARFRRPVGIAVQNETTAQSLERERRELPPPPVRMLVADSGNNLIRRISEDGQVETIGTTNVSAPAPQVSATQVAQATTRPIAPLSLNAPTAVASDASGNVFVTESSSGLVKTLLNTGDIVTAAGRTFSEPSGIAITDAGKLVVADAALTAQELTYAPPIINSISPSVASLSGGTQVTIRGQDFAPDLVVTISRFTITGARVVNSREITLETPALPGGRLAVSVRHRGGMAQGTITVDSPSLSELPAGNVTTFAGTDTFAADGTLATLTTITSPSSIALDQRGNLYVAERGYVRIRRIDAVTRVITTVAGTGTFGRSPDGLLATDADITGPVGIAIDRSGNLLFADGGRLRHVDAITRIISTIAGIPVSTGTYGDGGPSRLAGFTSTGGLAPDTNGDLYATDGVARIRKIDGRTGTITTYVGNGVQNYSGDSGPATQASIDLSHPNDGKGLAVDRQGNLFFTDHNNHVVRRVDATTKLISTVIGNQQRSGPVTDGGLATNSVLGRSSALALDSSGNILVGGLSRVRRVNPLTWIIQTVVGTGAYSSTGDSGPATAATLRNVSGIAADAAGNFFVADADSHRIRRVDTKGVITTIAGTGQPIVSPDGELARVSLLSGPTNIALDRSNGLLVTESTNNKLRRIDLQTGIITTIAGTGEPGNTGDNGPATRALLTVPTGVVSDPSGNIFILTRGEHRLRMVSASTGIISAVFGMVPGFVDGPAATATMNTGSANLPLDRQIAADSAGNIYIPDTGNCRIRRFDRQTNTVSTVAGSGCQQQGFFGDGGPATMAALNDPAGVIVDAAGNIFIADSGNHRIRKVDKQTGIITTIAGNGATSGPTGVGGPATAARLSTPMAMAMAFGSNQSLYFSERTSASIKRIDALTGILTTVAGGSSGFKGDGGPARNASFSGLTGIVFDASGNLFVVDSLNHRIRAIKGPLP